ncbi:MAG TPA: quinolinate synthase, partial [Solirubrobacterales bacterium]
MQELPTIQPTLAPELTSEQIAEIGDEVRALAQERNAVILAHNYELPEIQDVANYRGDSLGLSRQAAETDADVIAFCGVHFMAETASILSPEKTVLIPDLDAGCSLADSITADQLRAWKAEHPGALVVMYVNTSAEVKAETDYCVTSSNAVDVVRHIWDEHGPEQEILFGPDMWLGAFVERETGLVDEPERRGLFHIWDGECHVHAGIKPLDIVRTREEHPNAEFLIHPECGCSTQAMEYVAAGDI